ncbi:MAG: glutamate-5-semialdehyde dehydrogenase [Candidatus Omnitrophica bacterium]|jgi:glutamate-5-semialdehyde dehydrogenase|nr:glutamate-5-semialdehyde dehydrogenase [Candidatus Omnitrophota bacterium]
MDTARDIIEKTQNARIASKELANASSADKNKALMRMADGLGKERDFILSENRKDVSAARREGLSKAMIDRLMLDARRLNDMAVSIRAVARLSDPCGSIDRMWKTPSRLIIGKMRIPIGVIAIVYESRPNVTSDCASLCLKSGNSVILKGGKESIRSNMAICEVLKKAVIKAGLPAGCISLIESTDRKAVPLLLKQDKYIDLVIPRGGEGLIKAIAEISRIPVIKHYKGVCHVYVDKDADIKKALKICLNAKTQRPGVCNAMETMLVHKDIAGKFMPRAVEALLKQGVEIRGCLRAMGYSPRIKKASEADWYKEYLGLVLAVRIVDSARQAMAHIAKYGSGHSDAIVTSNYAVSLEFLKHVDSACVYSNASTRFTDGFQFGFGSEIGISTDRIHARGPMALQELTIYKYIIIGDGQIRK